MFQKNRRFDNEKGFTLMELLVVIFILSLIFVPIFKVIGWNFDISSEGLAKQKQQEDFRVFNYAIAHDLLFAKDIKITNNIDSDTISYAKQNGKIETFLFQKDGLYRRYDNETIKLVNGTVFDENLPTVYFESNGMIRFNFYATDIHSLLFLTIKPRLISL